MDPVIKILIRFSGKLLNELMINLMELPKILSLFETDLGQAKRKKN